MILLLLILFPCGRKLKMCWITKQFAISNPKNNYEQHHRIKTNVCLNLQIFLWLWSMVASLKPSTICEDWIQLCRLMVEYAPSIYTALGSISDLVCWWGICKTPTTNVKPIASNLLGGHLMECSVASVWSSGSQGLEKHNSWQHC